MLRLLSDADLHLHTSCSDGRAEPEELAEALSSTDLAVAAVTDHDTLEGALRVARALRGRRPEIVIGTEVSTAEGHVLALYVDRDIPRGLSAEMTVHLIHGAGGLAIAAHPLFPLDSVGERAARLPFDAVETINGTPLGELANLAAGRRFRHSARAIIGGSDAHVLSAVGHVRTQFPGHGARELRAAIEAGLTRPVMRPLQHLRTWFPSLEQTLIGFAGTRMPARRTAKRDRAEVGDPDAA